MRRILFFCALCACAPAATLFSQNSLNDNSTNMVDFRVADDFSLATPGTVQAILFWYQAQFETDLDQVSWAFYGDSGGSLGSLIASGTNSASTSVAGNAFLASVGIPDLALGAGTYWLELHAGSSLIGDNGGFTVWWNNVDDNGTNAALTSNVPDLPATPIGDSGFQQLAFKLNGTLGSPVPEPSNAELMVCGAAVLLLRRYLKQRSIN